MLKQQEMAQVEIERRKEQFKHFSYKMEDLETNIIASNQKVDKHDNQLEELYLELRNIQSKQGDVKL